MQQTRIRRFPKLKWNDHITASTESGVHTVSVQVCSEQTNQSSPVICVKLDYSPVCVPEGLFTCACTTCATMQSAGANEFAEACLGLPEADGSGRGSTSTEPCANFILLPSAGVRRRVPKARIQPRIVALLMNRTSTQNMPLVSPTL